MNKTNTKEDSKYLAYLIEGIEKKRQLSINEINKSCITSKKQLADINVWYQNITNLIKNKPPTMFVKCLKLYQDPAGKIYKINYEYLNNSKSTTEVEFIIILWNDTE